MDQKTWLWKKRSSEKTIVANVKSDHLEDNKEELLPTEKEIALEKSVKILNEKVTSLISECNAKEEQLSNHAKIAQETMAGREKAEAELAHLRKDLDEALQQKFAANERLGNLNTALKDCMQQLSFMREEQEQRIRDAIMRTSKEFEKAHKKMEEKLSETSKKLANLKVENSQLSMTLLVKEKLIEDLSNRRTQVEAEFDALMSRLDSVEKENAFLRYELRMLEKDLDTRNEEIVISRLSADASQKQNLESVKKIKKLEAECQRLRVLVRKKIPGPVALANMTAEVEIQGRHQIETRMRKLNPITGGLVVRESARENLDISSKRISFLVDRLQKMEQENSILRDSLAKTDNDIFCSRTACAQLISKSSQAEAKFGEHHKAQRSMELAVSNTSSNELLSTSCFNISEEHETNCSRSWASALISELENFKEGDLKNTSEDHRIGISDMSLMDDFVEMEKLAIVSLDAPHGNSLASSDMHSVLTDSSKEDTRMNHVDSTGKELVPVDDLSDINQERQINNLSSRKHSDWLQTVLTVIMQQIHVSERSVDDLLEDIKIALHSETSKAMSSPHAGQYELLPISGYITWKSPATSPRVGSFEGVPDMCCSVEEKPNECVQSMNRSICKLIELGRRFDSTHLEDCNVPNNRSERDLGPSLSNQFTATEDYAIRVFGWKKSELATVLRQFIGTCNYLLSGKVDFVKFAAELSSALGWILENCISNHDTSGARYEFKHHVGCTAVGTATEPESAQKLLFEMEKFQSILEVEKKGLRTELNLLKSLQKDLELSLQLAKDENDGLAGELTQAQQSIRSLQTELETLRETKRMIEDLFENQKLINEDLDTQLSVAKVRLNDVSQKLSSLEVELEDRSHCCEELEGTCLELQLQLESITSKEMLKDHMNQEGKLLQTGWEIKAASAKLAECEATILNLGNQLQALAPPKEASYANRVLYPPRKTYKILNRHFSLLDRMLSEDNTGMEDLKSPKTKEIIGTSGTHRRSVLQMNSQSATYASTTPSEPSEVHLSPKHEEAKTGPAGALAVVVKKKTGGIGFLRNLLIRRKRRSKKTSFSLAV